MNPRIPRRDISGILLLDKPLGLSSNQALQRAKRLLRASKAGHTGSLDPLATGLLPLCFGQATKISSYLLDADKRYRARLRFGAQTTTGDTEGEVIATSDPSALTRAALEQAIARFHGPQAQVPPMYSALKRDGQPLYALARQGIEVERAARDIVIHELLLNDHKDGECEIEVLCSKGTYIRTLAEDLAAALDQRAHLVALRRTEVGSLRGQRLYTFEELEQITRDGGEAALDACLITPRAALAHWPSVSVDGDQARDLAQGRSIARADLPEVTAETPLAVLSQTGDWLGIGVRDHEGRLAPRRWMSTPA